MKKQSIIRLVRNSRIHLPVGYLALLFVLASLAVMPHANAIDPHSASLPNTTEQAPPKMLAIASHGVTGNTTSVTIQAPAGATSATSADMGNCHGRVDLKPNASRYFADATDANSPGALFCGGRPDFFLAQAPDVPSFSVINFPSTRTSLVIPALGAVWPDHPSTIGLASDRALTNNSAIQTRIVCGFDNNEGSILIDVYGQDGQSLTGDMPQQVDCKAPITVTQIAKAFDSGYVVIRSKPPVQCGGPFCNPSDQGPTIYGAVIVAAPTNANADVHPFGGQ